jgi:hypothetical protein
VIAAEALLPVVRSRAVALVLSVAVVKPETVVVAVVAVVLAL